MKPTQEQVIAWAREVWGDDSGKPWHESAVAHLKAFSALAYEAGRKDEKPVVNQKLTTEQEPVVWIDNKQTGNFLNVAPPQREWQGLTDEEINFAWRMGEANISEENFEHCYRAIEAKLREKNT